MNKIPRLLRNSARRALLLAAALGSGSAFAQGMPITLGGVQISGTGCPAPTSITAMLATDPMGVPQLQIEFPKASMSDMAMTPFRAAGPNGESECTVAMRMMLPPDLGPFSLALDGAQARIQFANPTPRGQLTIRSTARINAANAPVQTTRVPAQGGAELQAMALPLPGLKLRSDVRDTIDLRATLTLGVRGATDRAQLLLEGLSVNLVTQPAAKP